MWEDFAIAGAQIALVIGILIPLKWQSSRALVALALLHGGALAIIFVALGSVGLPRAALVTAVESVLWFALAIRYARDR